MMEHIKFESKFTKMILSKEVLLSEAKGLSHFLKINRKNSLTCWQKTLGEMICEVNTKTDDDTSYTKKRKISSEEQNDSLVIPEPNKFIKTEILEPMEESVSEPPRIKEEPMDPIIDEPEPALFSEANESETLKVQKVESHRSMKTENVKPEIGIETALFNDDDDDDPVLPQNIVKNIKEEECTGDDTQKIVIPDAYVEKNEECTGDDTHKIVIPDTYVELQDEVICLTDEILKLVLDASKYTYDSERPICEILQDYWKEHNLPKICKLCNSYKIVADATFRLFVAHFVDEKSVQAIYNNMGDHMKKYDFKDVMTFASQEVLRLREAGKINN